MAATAVESRLTAIEGKLDLLISEMEVSRRRSREVEELKEDLGRIAGEVFESVSLELEDISPHLDSGDLVHLAKKLLRNTRNLDRALDRFESLMDFLDDVAPLQKAAFLELLSTLDDLDQRGVFAFLAEVRALLERITTEFSAEDVRQLGENVVGILLTVRNFTQPEILRALNNALDLYRHVDVTAPEHVTYRQLIREARSPEVKRGLAMGVQFLKNVAGEAPQPPATGNGSQDSETQEV